MKNPNVFETFSDPQFKSLICNDCKTLQTKSGSTLLYELICLISVLDSNDGDNVIPNRTLQSRKEQLGVTIFSTDLWKFS